MAGSQIGAVIRAARERAGLSQPEAVEAAKRHAAQYGRKFHLHAQTLSDYERGKIKKVPLHVLEALAPIYRTTTAALLSGQTVEIGRSTETPSGSAGVAPSETEHIVDQVRRLVMRGRVRRDQGASLEELRRLERELSVAIQNGLDLGEGHPQLVRAFVDLLLYGGVPSDAPEGAQEQAPVVSSKRRR